MLRFGQLHLPQFSIAYVESIFAATPGMPGTFLMVIFASFEVNAIPDTTALLNYRYYLSKFLRLTQNLIRLSKNLYLLANSTDLICKTLAPKEESSNISSYVK